MINNKAVLICTVCLMALLPVFGQAAEHPLYAKAKEAKDSAEAINLYWQYFHEARGDSNFPNAADDFANLLADAKKFTELAHFADFLLALKPAPTNPLNTIAWALADGDTALDKALTCSQVAVAEQKLACDLPPPPERSARAWKERQGWMLSTYLDTKGYVLLKQGQYEQALRNFTQADSLGDDPEILVHLAQAYLKMDEPENALNQAVEALYSYEQEEHKKLDKLISEAYSRVNGSEKGLKAYLDKKLEQLRQDEYRKLVAERLNAPATEFELEALQGGKIKLADFRGKIVLVDFWATWCGPCKRELPLLQNAYSSWKKRGLELLAITTDKDTSKVAPFIEKNKYTFPVLFNNNTSKEYDISGIPTLFVVDKEGKIQYKHVGYRLDIVKILNLQIEALQKSTNN